MAKSIDTPPGKYSPKVPTKKAMNRTARIMADAVDAIAKINP